MPPIDHNLHYIDPQTGPLLAPAEAAGASAESIHGVLHTLQAAQNKNSTFSAANPPGVTIESGEVFEVQCLCASGGWVTRDGAPSPASPLHNLPCAFGLQLLF